MPNNYANQVIDLTTNQSIGVYDQTKVSVLGGVIQNRTLDGDTTVGPPPTFRGRLFEDVGVAPNDGQISPNGRYFISGVVATGITFYLYEPDSVASPSSATFVGQCRITLPAGTTTVRGIRVIDPGSFGVNDVSNTSNWYIFIAVTNSTTLSSGGLYIAKRLSRSDFTPILGPSIPVATASGQKAVYKHESSLGPVPTQIAGGIALDSSLTRVYFQNRDTTTTCSFHLFDWSATETTVVAGVTANGFIHSTGLSPVHTGTINQSNSVYHATFGASPNPYPGEKCLIYTTSSNLTAVKASDLTPAATSWPSLIQRDVLPTVNTYVAQTLTRMAWDEYTDSAYIQTSTFNYIVKKFVNTAEVTLFGNASAEYVESIPVKEVYDFGSPAVVGLDVGLGLIMNVVSQVGQRGFFIMRIDGDLTIYPTTPHKIITPVITAPNIGSASVKLVSQYPVRCKDPNIRYRTSGFAVPTGGFVDVPGNGGLGNAFLGNEIQFEITFPIGNLYRIGTSNARSLTYSYLSVYKSDEEWALTHLNSSVITPVKYAFKLLTPYAVFPSVFNVQAREENLTLAIDMDTQFDGANFEYSTDNGMSWLPTAAYPAAPFPNVAGTLVRLNVGTPSGTPVFPIIVGQ